MPSLIGQAQTQNDSWTSIHKSLMKYAEFASNYVGSNCHGFYRFQWQMDLVLHKVLTWCLQRNINVIEVHTCQIVCRRLPDDQTMICINSLWHRDAIRRQGTKSTLAQVMACCLTASSHYLNQCWLIISKVRWHSSEANIMRRSEDTNQLNKIENSIFRIASRSPRGQWVNSGSLWTLCCMVEFG